MVKFAYYDSKKTKQIKAEDALGDSKGTQYYCPEEGCEGVMTLRHRKGMNGITAYFAALPSLPHRKNPKCPYASSKITFEPEEYDESSFDLKKVFNQLSKKSEPPRISSKPSTNTRSIDNHSSCPLNRFTTVRALYALCKQYDPRETYNHKLIGYYLFDERSLFLYKHGIYPATLLVECAYVDEDRDCRIKRELNSIWLIGPAVTKKYIFVLNFKDAAAFSKMAKQLTSKKPYRLFAVLGPVRERSTHRESKRTLYTIDIYSGKQIHPIA